MANTMFSARDTFECLMAMKQWSGQETKRFVYNNEKQCLVQEMEGFVFNDMLNTRHGASLCVQRQ